MRRGLKTVAAILLAVVVLAGGGILLGQAGFENPISQAMDEAGTGAANAALDATGIKKQADTMLRENAGHIAEMTGIPEPMVKGMIDDLDVQSWQVTNLPPNAVATGSAQVDYQGVAVELTAYDDPSVVTVHTDMGAVTLAVPESAQSTVKYLQYL